MRGWRLAGWCVATTALFACGENAPAPTDRPMPDGAVAAPGPAPRPAPYRAGQGTPALATSPPQPAPGGTVVSPAGQPLPTAEVPPRNADQRFLRGMADLHEGIIRLAHAAMQTRHAHRMGDDPALSADAFQDPVRDTIVALLRGLYHDPHAPTPSVVDRNAADSIMRLPEAAFGPAFHTFMLQHAAAEVALIDRMRPALRNEAVRHLADQLRTAHHRELDLRGNASDSRRGLRPVSRSASRVIPG